MPDLVLRGIRGVMGEPGAFQPAHADLVVEGGRIAAVLPAGTAPRGHAEVEGDGLLALPGLVDGHVHFNDPGRSDWEGWACGSAAAAAGGVTTVVDMPIDSDPPTVTVAALQAKRDRALSVSVVDFALWGGLTPEAVPRAGDLLAAGAVGLKAFACDSGWDDFPAVDEASLLAGLRAVASTGGVVALHAELPVGAREGMADIETPVVAWAGRLAAEASARLHVVHVSSADAVLEASRWPGLTVETCPHYLCLDAEEAAGIGAVCNPPIRDRANQARLWKAVSAGLVHSIASDHSPCSAAMRTGPDPWAGLSGVQTLLPVLLTGGLDPLVLADLGTAAARILRLPGKGALAPGYDADLVLVDPAASWRLRPADLRYRHPVSPWLGRSLTGRVEMTLVRGRPVYRRAEGVTGESRGRFLRPEPMPGQVP